MHKITTFALVALLAASCGHKESDPLDDHDHGAAEAVETDDDIVLEPEIAAQFGVVVDSVARGDFNQVYVVSGEIVDAPNSTSLVSAPISGIVRFAAGMAPGKEVGRGVAVATISSEGVAGGNANQAAKAALDGAKRELDRLTPLYKDGIVTARAYNEALQAYEQAKASYSAGAASGVAKTVGSGVITSLLAQNGQFVEAGSPIAVVSSNTSLTLRADMPQKYYQALPTISTANIELPYSGEVVALSSLDGKRVASSQAVSSSRGYMPVYFTLDNDGRVLPGSILKVSLIGAPIRDAITVPVTALSEQQGSYFVYEQLDEECYQKLPVTIGASDGKRVQVLSGLEGGEHIVTEGVVAVRLAETSAVAPEGHSHNH